MATRIALATVVGVVLLHGDPCSAEAGCPSMFARPGGERVASCQEPAVPDSVATLARAYLAERTSASYQQANYVLLQDGTSALRLDDCRGEAVAYEINFEYAALRRVDSDWVRIGLFIPVDPSCPGSGFASVKATDGTIMEPKLPKSAATDAARRVVDPLPEGWAFWRATLRAETEGPNLGWKWQIKFRGPEQGGCYEQRNVEVNAVTGTVLSNTVDATCY
jgi:hypothetical protein